jgi:MSHA biogenesis protein MshJ
MNDTLKSVWARYEALTLRERALIAASVIAVVWLVWDWTAHRAIARSLTVAQTEVASLRERIASEVAVAAQLQKEIENDPNRRLAQEERALTAQVAGLDAQLESLVGGFVEPSMMPVLLEDVVTHHNGVTLTRVASLPVEPVRQQGTGDIVPGLYRHAMRVELRGSYFPIRDYLQELEDAPWRFSWRSLNYHVEQFPNATVVLDLETMSREKNWLGV